MVILSDLHLTDIGPKSLLKLESQERVKDSQEAHQWESRRRKGKKNRGINYTSGQTCLDS